MSADWWSQREVDPLKADIFMSDFLHLHGVKNLSHSTMEEYRAAFSKVLKITTDWDISSDHYISSVFAHLARDRVVQRNIMPSWNLTVILESLIQPPFEPMYKRHSTW